MPIEFFTKKKSFVGTKKSEEQVKNNLVLPFYTEQQKNNFQGTYLYNIYMTLFGSVYLAKKM